MVARRPNPSDPAQRSNHYATVRAKRQRDWSFLGYGLLRLLADLSRQPRDLTHAAHAILKILPEVDSQPSARLLQARKGVPCTPTQLTAGAAADLPLLHIVPDVALAQVVVQRHLRTLQDHQQLRTIRRHPFQHPVDRR